MSVRIFFNTKNTLCSRIFPTCTAINIKRDYAFKSDLKIKWVRPEKIPCIKPEKSGDLKPYIEVKKDDVPLDFKNSKELEDANDYVKRLFTLEFFPRYKTTKIARQEMIGLVQRHNLDQGSMESKIAEMTARIRSYQVVVDQFPRNKILKVKLKELIDKRKKFLKYLRRWDYKRFEWLLEKLDIVYKPPPSDFHWITRKESLQKLTNKYCEELKAERLEAYKKELENQQEIFLKDKIQKLEYIRSQQEAYGVPVTVKLSDIEEVNNKLNEILEKNKAMKIELNEDN